ncbi:MAG: hypothetical protein R2797_11080 [Gelidibacter sp.]
MNKTHLFLTLTLLSFFLGNAQELIDGQLNGGNRVNGLISTTPVVLNETVEGSPYINDEFLPAKISASEDNVFYVRYNAIADQFEVKGENNKAYALNKYRRDIVVQLVGVKKTYQVFGYLDENDNENFGYFVIINGKDSNVKLLKKEKKFFIGEKVATTSYDTPKPATYKRANDEYYIKVGEDAAIEMPTNKKDIAKLFPKQEKNILSFIKENKIKTKKEEDLNMLMEYINQIS